MRVLLVLLAVLVAGCSASSSGSDHYQLGEFFISGPNVVSEQTESVSVENSGEFPHTLVVTRADGVVLAATDLVPPGQTVTLELALDPGTYQFTCRIVGQDSEGQLVDHYERGMHATITVADS